MKRQIVMLLVGLSCAVGGKTATVLDREGYLLQTHLPALDEPASYGLEISAGEAMISWR